MQFQQLFSECRPILGATRVRPCVMYLTRFNRYPQDRACQYLRAMAGLLARPRVTNLGERGHCNDTRFQNVAQNSEAVLPRGRQGVDTCQIRKLLAKE